MLALAASLTLAAPRDALAQEASAAQAEPEREGWALVGFWAPGLQRIGLLVPLSERLILRPDIRGQVYGFEGIENGWFANPGVSLILRTRPQNSGWVYASLRAALLFQEYEREEYGRSFDYLTNAFTLTAGGHAHLGPLLSVFGEAGASYSYQEEGADVEIYRQYDLVARFGFALRRPRIR
jgi:hypothetical protein